MEANNILQRAADKANLVRAKYESNNVPTNITDVCLMVFFGDYRALSILSSLILKRYREQTKGSKYFILCSWPGCDQLFPYVDEYWTCNPSDVTKLVSKSNNFSNSSDILITTIRNLNYFFEDVLTYDDLSVYYNNGITQNFWDTFKHAKRYFPSIPSANILGTDIIKNWNRLSSKVLVYPAKNISIYTNGKCTMEKVPKIFWVHLCNTIKNEGYEPLICINDFTHDLSTELTDFINFKIRNIMDLLVVMRYSRCVLDVFTGISRLAIIARAPFICVDERMKSNLYKEYEIDGLLAKNLPKEYIYGFPTIINNDNPKGLNINLFDNIVSKLRKFDAYLDKVETPPAYELEEIVPYSEIKAKKIKKMGLKFIKIRKD